MRANISPRTVRKLLAADGYLQLQMPQRAVDELHGVGDAGPLEGPRQLMLGMSLKSLNEASQAIRHLEKAARIMPRTIRRFAWQELADCYRAVGSEPMAELAESLGGDDEFQLRIAVPNGEITLDRTRTTAIA